MLGNPSDHIAKSEMRLRSKTLAKRLLCSLGFGGLLLLLRIYFGPPGLVTDVIGWGYWTFIFRLACYLHSTAPALVDSGTVRQAVNAAKYGTMVYHQTHFWVVSLALTLGSSAGFFALLTYISRRKALGAELDNVKRGAQLVPPKLHNKQMKEMYKKRPPTEMGRKLRLGTDRLIIPESLQHLHIALIGASGEGKSTAIFELIEQIQKRGDKALVVDLGGELFSKFGRDGDHVLSLRDPRSEAWDFWHEPAIPPEAMAESIIKNEGGPQFFPKNARRVFAALLKRTSSVPQLLNELTNPTSDLIKALAADRELAAKALGSSESEQSHGLMGTATQNLDFLNELNQWAQPTQEPFSISRWVNDHDDPSWIYALYNETEMGVSAPLLRLWFDIACLASLQRDPEDPKNRHTWLIVDETKSVGELHSLPAILDKGRKFKVTVLMGLQAKSQLRDVYGEAGHHSILQGLQNQILFRMVAKDSADYVSELLGDQEVEQTTIGANFGPGDAGERGSINKQIVHRRLVTPAEIRTLGPMHFFLRLARHHPVKSKFKMKKYPRRQGRAKSVQNPSFSARSNPQKVSQETSDTAAGQTEGAPEEQPGFLSPDGNPDGSEE